MIIDYNDGKNTITKHAITYIKDYICNVNIQFLKNVKSQKNIYKDVNLSDNGLFFPVSNCQNTLTYQNDSTLFKI